MARPLFLLLAALAILSAPRVFPRVNGAPNPPDNMAGDDNIYQTLRARGLTDFAGYVTAAGMQQMLTSTVSRFTVFAPTNAAFSRLTDAQRAALADPNTLQEVMRYHMLSGEVPSRSMDNDILLPTLSTAGDIRINVYGSGGSEHYYANGAALRPADVTASNGLIHVIDEVLFRPAFTITALVKGNPNLSRISDMLAAGTGETAKLLDGTEPYTLFAPTDDAFAQLSQATLDYIRAHDPQLLDEIVRGHVLEGTLFTGGIADGGSAKALSGDTLTFAVSPSGVHSVNGAAIVVPDMAATNGVVHAVDHVIIPAADLFRRLVLLGLTDFATLVDEAGMRDTLSRPEQTFTVFAPTNEALATLTDAERAALKNADVLMRFVRYHMAGGAIHAGDLKDEEVLPVLDAPYTVRFNRYNNALFANGRPLLATDQSATNGIVHIVGVTALTSPTLRTSTISAYDEILRREDTKMLATALASQPEIANILKGSSPLTVFLPNDAAFAALPAGTTTLLRKYPTVLASVLKYHIAAGTHYTAGLAPEMTLPAMNGQNLKIGTDGKMLTVNGVPFATADSTVTNGVVHTIGAVLFPQGNVFEATVFGGMKELANRLDSSGLREALEDQTKRFTLFAFSDAAFNRLSPELIARMDDPKMLRGALAYHIADRIQPSSTFGDDLVVPTMGGVQTVPGVRINIYPNPEPKTAPSTYVNGHLLLQPDVPCTNGLVHVIDGVLFPLPADSIAAILASDPRFEGLRNLTAASGVAPLLTGKGPLTLFAPTEQALQKLPPGVRGILLANPQVAEGILRYHLAFKTFYSPALYDGALVKTASGSYIPVARGSPGVIRVGNAGVLEADYSAGNGVVHVIDELLVPPERDLMQQAIFSGLSEFLALATASGIDQHLTGEEPVTVFAVANGALDRLPPDVRKRLQSDEEFLKATMAYHVVHGAVTIEGLSNDRLLRPLSPGSAPLRSNVYGVYRFINGVPVVAPNVTAVNGMMHVLRDFVFPPTSSLLDRIVADGRFKTFVEHLRATGLAASLNGTTAFTVLPPTDDAFAAADPARIYAWSIDYDDRRRMVLNHIALTTWASGGIALQSHLPVLSGEKLPVSGTQEGNILIAGAAPLQRDVWATNGVAHPMGVVLDPGAVHVPSGGKKSNHLGLILGITIPVAVLVAAVGIFIYKKTRHSEYTRI